MARIREAHIGEDGDFRVLQKGASGGWRVLLGAALIAGGVWVLDAAYGERAQQASYQVSETVSN